MTSTSPNLFSDTGKRKVSKISMSTYVYTIEIIIAIFPGPIADILPYSVNKSGTLAVFFRKLSLNASLDRHQIEVPTLLS